MIETHITILERFKDKLRIRVVSQTETFEKVVSRSELADIVKFNPGIRIA